MIIIFWNKFGQGGQRFPVQKRKFKFDCWIQHILISVDTRFQLKLAIMIFWNKFAPKRVFPVKCSTKEHYRSSHQRCSVRKSVFRNFTKFTGKHLCQSLFLNKLLGAFLFPSLLFPGFSLLSPWLSLLI